MTVYELIQELAKYPPNVEVIPWQDRARTKREVASVHRPIDYPRQGQPPIRDEDFPVLLRLEAVKENK